MHVHLPYVLALVVYLVLCLVITARDYTVRVLLSIASLSDLFVCRVCMFSAIIRFVVVIIGTRTAIAIALAIKLSAVRAKPPIPPV